MKEKRDFRPLRKLLASWNLADLADHFENEDINIEELQILKSHHISMILRNYRMGLRIRFEHYFEKWRRDMNQPLQTSEDLSTTSCFCSCHCKTATPAPLEPLQCHPEAETKSKSAEHTEETQMTIEIPPSAVEVASTVSPNADYRTDTSANVLHTSLTAESNDHSSSSAYIEVKDILLSFGTIGTSILQFYQKNKELAPTHRSLLIQLIVDYFDQNGLHLSLNTSHNLESQILKLFPSEKLRYYRKEKRGKIYVKFVNMKRYRRERPWQRTYRRSRFTCQSTTKDPPVLIEGDSDNSNTGLLEEATQGYDNWHDPLSSQGNVKNEIETG